MPLRAIVAVPSLRLSASWLDFGTCFVNQQHTQEVYLMNLSGCLSFWTVLMGMLGLPYAAVPRLDWQDPRKGCWVLSKWTGSLGLMVPDTSGVPGCPAQGCWYDQ